MQPNTQFLLPCRLCPSALIARTFSLAVQGGQEDYPSQPVEVAGRRPSGDAAKRVRHLLFDALRLRVNVRARAPRNRRTLMFGHCPLAKKANTSRGAQCNTN